MPMRDRQFLRTLLAAVAVGCAWHVAPADDSADVDPIKMRKVKAAYLLNFARFIEWPASVPAAPDTPFQIGIVGPDPFGSVLDETIQGRTVGGRALVVRRLDWSKPADREAAGQCQILYVGAWRDPSARAIASALEQKPIVLVGEGSNLVDTGGAIGFALDAGRVVFYVNRDALAKRKLNASSQLLKVARLVEPGPSTPETKP